MNNDPLTDLRQLRALLTPPRYPFPDPAIVYYHPDDVAQVAQVEAWAAADKHRLLAFANEAAPSGKLIVCDVAHMAATVGMDVERYWADTLRAQERRRDGAKGESTDER